MYQLLHKVTLNAQIGPFETFEELQSAVATQTPGSVCIPPGRSTNAKKGEVKDAQGNVTGEWTVV